MGDSDLTSDDTLKYWRGVFDDLIHWYDIADSKAMGIITINGILLSFITLGSILNPEQNISHLSEVMNMNLFYLIILFIFSVLISVILAVSALWARIKPALPFSLPRLTSILGSNFRASDKEKPLAEEEKFSHPTIFFSYIADRYSTNEKKRKGEGIKYFNEQITKSTSMEMLLKAIAVEITILSSNTNKKYKLINLSFILVAISLGLMSSIVLLMYIY